MWLAMIRARYLTPLALASHFLAAAPASAASDLDVLPQGRYGCWTSGDATGPAVNTMPERSFDVVRGSSYLTMEGRGTYLLASDILTFTRGPLKDMRLRLNKEGLWQQLDRDGEAGRLKCNRLGPAPSTWAA